MRPGRLLLGLAGLGAAAGVVGALAAGPHGAAHAAPSTAARATPDDAASGLPPPPAPAFRVPKPRRLTDRRDEAAWAPVRRAAVVRAAPRAGARAVGTLARHTPEGTDAIVAAAGRTFASSRGWVRVRIPALPANATGWVPRRALGGFHFLDTLLVVDRARLSLTLYRHGRRVFRAPVGIGRAGSPTPAGRFYVRSELTRFASPFYGPLAFGTSARSPTLTDWPAGGYIGIHGTNEPDLIPGRVSHGCIRLRNADILRLARLLPIGTPLVVR